MVRWILLVGLLAGCGQIFGLDQPRLADAARGDSSLTDTAIDGQTFAGCASDANLVACYDFEDTVDDAAPMPNTTTATGVNFLAGKQGKAINLGGTSRVTIEDSTLLDVDMVTIEAWVLPKDIPSGTARAGILDVDGQYAIFIAAGGNVLCAAGTASLESTNAIPVGEWSHVACAIGSSSVTIYVDGAQVANDTVANALPTAPVNGGEIGGNAPDGADRLHGFIDLMRVYRTMRSAAEICADAACH